MTARDPSSDDPSAAASQRWNRAAPQTEPNSPSAKRPLEEAVRLSDEVKAQLQRRAELAAERAATEQATTERASIKRADEFARQTRPVGFDPAESDPVVTADEVAGEAESASEIDLNPVIDITASTRVADQHDASDVVMAAKTPEEPKQFIVSKLGDPLPDLSPPPPSLPPRRPLDGSGPPPTDPPGPGHTRPMSKLSPDEDESDEDGEPDDRTHEGDAEATVVDSAADEITVDEAVAEETVAEETVAEETVAEETVAEETVADETAVDETVADETAVDETVADETAVEELAADPPDMTDSGALVPLQHAVLPALVESEPTRSRAAPVLLLMATALAVLSGILGGLWLKERSNSNELRDQVALADAAESVTDEGLEELNREIQTLRLQNDQLQQERNDLSALVLELPAGRVTEIAVPFTPVFADEENGRLIAIGAAGEYITWGEGADGPITDSGSVSGRPTGLFAATRKAWVSTDAGQIDVLSMVAGEPGLPSVDFGPSSFMAADDRGYWTYNEASSEVVRLKKSDGSITAAVGVPVRITDLTIGAGSVWALGENSRVYRINTADLTVQAIDAGEDLISVTATPDALWTLSAADGSLRRVDPVTGEVLVTVPVGRDPIDSTFAGQAVWVALRSGSSLIEVDTRTSAVVSRTTLPSEPTALHQGDSGVFVTTNGDVPLVRVASLTVDAENEADATDEGSDGSESSTDDS